MALVAPVTVPVSLHKVRMEYGLVAAGLVVKCACSYVATLVAHYHNLVVFVCSATSQTDVLYVADSVTTAMSSLVDDLNSGSSVNRMFLSLFRLTTITPLLIYLFELIAIFNLWMYFFFVSKI